MAQGQPIRRGHPGQLLPITASSAAEGSSTLGCPHGGSPWPGAEPPAASQRGFPSPGIHPRWAPARRAHRDSRDLLRNPGQEAPLDACPSGLEVTLERSSLLGFKVFSILKNSQQPPLNLSAGKTSLSLLRPRFQPGCSPPTPAVPCRGAVAGGCRVCPVLPAPLQPLLLPPLPFGFNFLPRQPMSKRGPRGSPQATTNRSRKHPSRRPGLARSPRTPARAATSKPSQSPFLWGFAKKNPTPSSWRVGDAAGRHSGKGDIWVSVLPGGFWLLRVREEEGMLWRREQGQHLVFSNKGIKHLKPETG